VTDLTDYLSQVADLVERASRREGWRYGSYERFVLENGRSWPLPTSGKARPKGLRKMPNRQCYENALHVCLEHEFDDVAWQYVEGYAQSLMPVQHAWCIDSEGRVVDPTWPDLGAEYYGIAISLTDVRKVVLKTRYYGVLPNDFLNEFTVLKEGRIA
jgi:hypothetical protein